MKRRILSIITALALCLSLCPTWAFATEADPSLCKHHPAHTEDCGYTAPAEGHDCGHEHGDECYSEETRCAHVHDGSCYSDGLLPAEGEDRTADACAHVCSAESGCVTRTLDCQHSHDSACGYVQADPGTPCGYVCRVCTIEDLIAALPDTVTEDNAADVQAQLDRILDLYRELTEAEQGQLDLSRVTELQGALDAANDPDMIEGEVPVAYQEASWNDSEVTYTDKTADSCTPVADSTEAVTWNAGWYVVNSTVTISEPITVTGAVNLILADGCTLNAEKGIVVETGNSLTIYAQSGGTGTLTVTGTTDSDHNASAGIGGSETAPDSGTITIHGGEIKATGGGQSGYRSGAGIGGGAVRNGNGGNSGAITIYGGTITANSGEGNVTGAGIGGGASGNNGNGGAGSNITIYGGSVTAASTGTDTGGAGIGGGGGTSVGGAGEYINIYGGTVNAIGSTRGAGIGGGGGGNDKTAGAGTNITVSGGIVTAVGGKYAAGIGGGGGYKFEYSGTVTSNVSGGIGSVTISGGIVDAKGGDGNSSGNYAGDPIGNGGNTTATATVNKTTGIVFENGAGTVCGDVTFDGSYEVPAGYSLHIPAGASLSGSGTLSGGGTFTTENLTAYMISVPSNLYYDGKDRTEYLTTELSAELTRGVTICGQTFTVSGWTLAVAKTDDLHYTATYTNDSDNTKTVQKTITLLQSGTDLTDGKVKTYNGDTLTTSFSAGDTITVKATPTPTGDAPQKAAARLRGEPGTGQMALYVGDALVSSEAANADTDGSYTMTVSAADVLLAAGGPGTGITLTAKFIGNDNMADGEGTVKVNITAVAKAERDGNVIDYFGVSDFEGTNNLFCQNVYADATITLLGDVQPSTNSNASTTCSTMVNITCTLDLAGHNFTSTDTAIYVLPMGNLTIQDSSTGKTGNVSFIKSDGTLTLYGGTFGKIETAYTLASLLAENCAYYKGSTPIRLSELADQKELTGPVTVQECQHTGVEVTDLGSGKHGLDCPYCGYHSEHTTTLTATASGNTVTLNGGCDTEGCNYAVELGTVSFTFENMTYGQENKVSYTWDGPEGYYGSININGKEDDSSLTSKTLNLSIFFGDKAAPAMEHTMTLLFHSDANMQGSNECELKFTVAPAPLTPSITGTATKTYDGTTDCDGTGLSIALDGVVNGDDVTATATGYAYDNANAGENKTITASGITLEGSSKDNYTLSSTTATTTGTITKSQPTISFVSGYNPSKTYDGQTISNPTADDLTITGANFSDVTFEWSATPKDAGTYTLNAKIAETNNTEAAEAVLTVTIRPKTVTPTITITPDSYKYTGSAIHPSGSAVKVMDGDTVIPDSEYTLSYGENTQVGTGSVTVTDKENGNYKIAQTTETFAITKANQAPLTITGAPGSVTYGDTFQLGVSGGSGTGALSWAASGATVDNAGNVTITRAGTVAITAVKEGDSNYVGTEGRIMLDVDKADLTADGTGTASGTYGNKLSELTVSGLTAKLGEAPVAGTWKLTGDAVPNVGDSGEYTATFTPASGADNYNPLEAKVKLNIAKADYTGTKNASTSAKFGSTGTYDLSALLPGGATAGTAATDSDIFEGTPAVSGKTLTYKLAKSAAPNATGTITVPVTSANYNDFNLTVTVKVTDKDVPTLTVSPITVTYTGEAIPGTVIKGTAKVGSTTVPGTWSFKDAAPAAVADSGVKTVLFTPTDGTNYAAVEATVMVTISKATPTGAPKYTAISASGKTLADAGLTTEGGTFSTEGTVAWALGTDTAVTANTQYEWTFTPADAANYNTLTGKITLWVQSTGGGSYVPSGPSSPGTSTLPVTTTGQGSSTTTTTTTAAPTASTQGGTATTTINTTMGQEIVKQAVANNSETVVIAPKVTGSVTKAEVSIPASTVGQIGSQTSASLTVSTPVADVTIPNGGLGSLGSVGGTVTVTAEQTGNSVELTVTAGGQTVQNVPGGVTLTVPAASTTPGTVAVLVHPDGTREVVRKSVADNGAVTIPLDGSAKLEIVDNSGYFADVPATSWEADAVAFASSHELFNGTAPGQFSPNTPMSRGMLAVVLHNLESNPAQALTGAFTDVDNSQWYAEGVAWAEAQGIIGGYGNGQFGPNDNITREQLAVMLWRYAGSPAATDRELHFADAHRASDWALEALRWATEKGIINGKGGGILDPTGQATRAETAQMLKNFMENQ